MPPSTPLSWSYVNRGALVRGVLRAGIQIGCATTSALDVGVASTTCTAIKTLVFNVTIDTHSEVQLAFWVGCTAPTNATGFLAGRRAARGGCSTWRTVPAPGGPVSALRPSVTRYGATASYTWANSLAAAACSCESAYWAVSVAGTFSGLPLTAANC